MAHHSEQVASVIQRVVQEILARGLNDPRVRGLVSVTGVEISSDRREATVSVSVIPAEHAELTMHGLRHATPHVQRQVAERIGLRRMPRLTFRLDETLKKEAAVFAAIKEGLRRESERGSGPAPGPEKDVDP